MSELNYVDGLIWYFVFIYTTIIHEAAHAWAGLKLGDATAYHGGQVSLDPVPHVRREPFGMVVVPILSWLLNGGNWMIGWASAPYDPLWAQRHPRRAAWMAMAGPASNLVLLLVSGLLLHFGLKAGVFALPERLGFTHLVEGVSGRGWEFAATLLSITFALQVVLISFNLMPLPPLDGSALPLFFLSPKGCEQYQDFIANPTIRFLGLVIAWQLFGRIVPIAFGYALHFLYGSM